uniref:Uncharacterized protein n=1 Tax=Strix occidentalis caurina TaxID=311401 RepID=A0A8D0EVR8_STROC
MAAPVEVCHVACCANRAGGGVVSWGRGGLLAFGSCRDVVLYQPTVRRAAAALRGHAGRVNCVRWVRRRDGGEEKREIEGMGKYRSPVWVSALILLARVPGGTGGSRLFHLHPSSSLHCTLLGRPLSSPP